jgi:hypothetical protein
MKNQSNTAAVLADLASRIKSAHAQTEASMSRDVQKAIEAFVEMPPRGQLAFLEWARDTGGEYRDDERLARAISRLKGICKDHGASSSTRPAAVP